MSYVTWEEYANFMGWSQEVRQQHFRTLWTQHNQYLAAQGSSPISFEEWLRTARTLLPEITTKKKKKKKAGVEQELEFQREQRKVKQ